MRGIYPVLDARYPVLWRLTQYSDTFNLVIKRSEGSAFQHWNKTADSSRQDRTLE